MLPKNVRPHLALFDIITLDLNFGYGIATEVEVAGAKVEIGGKAYYSLDDIYINPSMTFEASVQAKLTNKISAGIGGHIKVDTYSGQKLEKARYAGVRIGDEILGLDEIVEGSDFILSAGAGLYLGAGGEAHLNINLSEAFRRIKKYLN